MELDKFIFLKHKIEKKNFTGMKLKKKLDITGTKTNVFSSYFKEQRLKFQPYCSRAFSSFQNLAHAVHCTGAITIHE